MWLSKAGYPPTLVPDTMPETIARCLGDGWVECADPRERAAVTPEPVDSERERRAAGNDGGDGVMPTSPQASTAEPAVPAPPSPKPTTSKAKPAVKRGARR